MAKQTLESWIHEAMIDGDKDQAITGFNLAHVGSGETDIHHIKFGSKAWTPSEVSQLFRHKAEGFAQDLPGVQTFVVYAFYGKNEPEAKHPFTVTGTLDTNLMTESPDARGLTIQGMRHLEAGTQMAFRSLATSVDAQQRMIDSLIRDNLDTRRENRELIGILKDVVMTQAANNHDRKLKELEYERTTKERDKWIGFLPGLVNNILGKEVFPQGTEDTAHLQALADAMSEEDLKKLSGKVRPEQLGPIANRLKKYYEEKKVAEQNDKLLAAKTPEDDAAGD